jgi:RNA polymerase sigma-70 factor (ECF subfamily)
LPEVGNQLGIARRVFAQHCEAVTRGRDVVVRMTSRRALSGDEIDDLVGRIDAERAGRDVVGMTPKEAAAVLGISSGAVRIRLFRVRGKIRDLAVRGGQR